MIEDDDFTSDLTDAIVYGVLAMCILLVAAAIFY
jgi:hypothetical protein